MKNYVVANHGTRREAEGRKEGEACAEPYGDEFAPEPARCTPVPSSYICMPQVRNAVSKMTRLCPWQHVGGWE